MKHDRPHTLLPRGLSRVEAAEYIGISPTKFDELVRTGAMPVPKEIGTRRIWDRHGLDSAFDDLPSIEEKNPFDGVRA